MLLSTMLPLPTHRQPSNPPFHPVAERGVVVVEEVQELVDKI
jgi:hypothetical protein